MLAPIARKAPGGGELREVSGLLCFACIPQHVGNMSWSPRTHYYGLYCVSRAFSNILVALLGFQGLPLSLLLLCVACIQQDFTSMTWSPRTFTITDSIVSCMHSATF